MARYLIVEEGPLKGFFIDLKDEKKYLVGRDPDKVDIVLEDAAVSREHVLIDVSKDSIGIKNLSHVNPTLVNDNKVEGLHILKKGDLLKIGRNIFLYSEGPLPKREREEERLKKQTEFETIFEEPESDEMQDVDTIFEEEENFEKIAKSPKGEEEKTVYDTIFEEESKEERFPFDLISEHEIILKVISGPNSGAEFGMEKERSYTIGKDANICDIVFNDLSVSKSHAKISIDESGDVFIEDLGSRNGVLVNSKKIKEKKKISSQDKISLGTTSFLILNQKEAVETIYAAREEVYEEKKKEKTPWKKQIIPTNHLVIAGSFVVVLFSAFISLFSLFKGEQVEIEKKDPTTLIKSALEKFEGVRFSYNPAGEKLFLVGHVLTPLDEKELLYNIDEIGFIEDIENNIIIDEYVWKNTNDILSGNKDWRSVSMHSPEPGVFVVTGYMENEKKAEELADYLNTNFPYLDKLVNNVVIEDILKSEVATLLIKNGLSSLSYQLINGELILAGRYTKEDRKKFKECLDTLKKTKGIRKVKNLSIETSPDIARINISDQYKVSGYIGSDDKKMAVVINDKMISVGDSIDGMKITSIDENRIYLEKGGFKYKIEYKQQ